MHKVYRGKDLGTVDINNIDQFIKDHGVKDGTWNDLFLGDYFESTLIYDDGTTSLKTFRIVDLDVYYETESTAANNHHLCIVPDRTLMEKYIGTGRVTGSGYNGSPFIIENVIPKIDAGLKNTFGDHALTYTEILSTSSGTTNIVRDVKAILMNEIEIFGYSTYSMYSCGYITNQLALFAINETYKQSDRHYWERDVNHYNYEQKQFCYCSANGAPGHADGGEYMIGIRPRFLLG